MLEVQADVARHLHAHLILQVEANARLAIALGMDVPGYQLHVTSQHCTEAFEARYGCQPLPADDIGFRK